MRARAADVLVVGAGPAGLHLARCLAGEGFETLVFEEHPVIGEPVDCSGVIGANSFDEVDLPRGTVIGEIRVLQLLSPGGVALAYRNGGTLAYVTDRGRVDQALAARARVAGGRIETGAKVTALRVQEDGVEAIVRRRYGWEVYRARAAAIAAGPRYSAQHLFGMGRPRQLLRTAQAEVQGNGFREATVFFGPGGGEFTWVVPFPRGPRGYLRVGAAGGAMPGRRLQGVLEGPLAAHLEAPPPRSGTG